MRARLWVFGGVVLLAAAWTAQPVLAAITSVGGSVSAELKELRTTGAGATDQQSKAFPDGSNTLPLQIVARLVTADKQAAASLAVQFADPRTVPGPNPEEFALNFALVSISPDVHYEGHAVTQEVRGVLFAPGELGSEPAGTPVTLSGSLFLDGALAVFANTEVTDLTGASLVLRVTIMKEVEGRSAEQVFDGTLQVTGGTDRQVTPTASGALPTSSVFSSDLAFVDPQLSVFRAFILSNLKIDYTYQATVGQAFTLRATIDVEATNIPGKVGVAGILGTPIDTLQQVISTTMGTSTGQKMTTALQQERAAPTGQPAFPDNAAPQTPGWPLGGLCGLFGVEALAGTLALVGLCGHKRASRRPRV